jgi:homoserine O-succinyltransferase/O-acetyltransferase
MPLCSNSNCKRDPRRGAHLQGDAPSPSSRCIRIGLLNNMPDSALEATERQFRVLLASASDGMTVRLSLYALNEVPRNEAGKGRIAERYSSAEQLYEADLDGLIVTGAEPRTANLVEEPYWDGLARVIEWAREHTHSTVFSCLAAHAAVLHMDGIGRQKSDDKLFGVFKCSQNSDHRLTAGIRTGFALPHSRWNGISEVELAASGYSVLTSSPNVGVDMFIKQNKSLFVFFQGHPEYETDTLSREYRRDVGRYLRGERDTYPSLPQDYFDEDTESALHALRTRATQQRSEELLTYVSTTLERGTVDNSWRSTAACIFRNWLQYIHDRKAVESSRVSAGNLVTNLDVEALDVTNFPSRPDLIHIQVMT